MLKAVLKRVLPAPTVASLVRSKQRVAFARTRGWRYFAMSRHLHVAGFLDPDEAVHLYDMAAALPSRDPVVVEIGSWVGKSSVVLANALARRGAGMLYCVDPFDMSGDTRSAATYQSRAKAMPDSLLGTFTANVRAAGVEDYVQPIRGLSHEVVTGWDRPIDLIFIDGNHAYDAVKRDFLDWSRHVKPGGLVAFHDTWFAPPPNHVGEYHTGPGAMIRDCILGDAGWEPVGHVVSLYVIRKRAA